MTTETADDEAPLRTWAPFLIAAALACLTIVILGLGLTFFADEWAFIETRSSSDPGTWLAPHNEHWTTVPILVYRLLVETVGIGSYLPYLLVVALLHVVVAALVYRLLLRSSGRIFALAGAVIVLFFGSGFENLFWGFQLGFIGALALGLGCLVIVDRGPTLRRAIIVAGLLLVALMSTGVGLVVSIAVGTEWLIDRRWRRYVPILLVPAGIYLVWLVTIGRSAVAARRDPLSASALADVPTFVADGIGNALAAITGLPQVLAVIAVAVAITIAWRRDDRGLIPFGRVLGLGAAIAIMYALSGLVRAQTLVGAADYPRYTYVSGVLMLVLVGALIGRVTIPNDRPSRLATVGVLSAWLTAALLLNVSLLLFGRSVFQERADMTRALVTVALDPDRPAGVDLDRSLVLVPAPAVLERLAARYGDPRGDRLVPWAVRPIPPAVLTEARRRLVEGAPIPGLTSAP
jgi:hypothetical protein